MRGRVAVLAAAATAALAVPALADPYARPVTSIPEPSTGWFTGPVTVSWDVSGTINPQPGDTCTPTTVSEDTQGRQLSCTVSMGSISNKGSITIHLDKTAPVAVTAAAARAPDAAGWYTAPVALAWSGQDLTSGIASCTAMTYTGPDGASVAPVGKCTDRAGNSSAAVPFPLSFDVTPPGLSDVSAKIAGTTATLRWTPAVDVASTSIVRQDGAAVDVAAGAREATNGPLTRGAAYTWTVTVRDAAGNAASATASATVPATLSAKAASATRRTVRWKARPNAKYYNLQLFRNGRKVLTAWPTKPHYTLPRTWRLRGRTHRLVAGVYRWYAWPGYGARARHRYGRLLASGKVTLSAAAVRAAYR